MPTADTGCNEKAANSEAVISDGYPARWRSPKSSNRLPIQAMFALNKFSRRTLRNVPCITCADSYASSVRSCPNAVGTLSAAKHRTEQNYTRDRHHSHSRGPTATLCLLGPGPANSR